MNPQLPSPASTAAAHSVTGTFAMRAAFRLATLLAIGGGVVGLSVEDSATKLRALVDEMVQQADSDADGSLSLNDFTKALLQARITIEGAVQEDDECMCHATNSFALIDTNTDYRVDKNEIFAILHHLDAIRAIDEEADNEAKDKNHANRELSVGDGSAQLGGTHAGIPMLGGAHASRSPPPAAPPKMHLLSGCARPLLIAPVCVWLECAFATCLGHLRECHALAPRAPCVGPSLTRSHPHTSPHSPPPPFLPHC